MAEETSTELSLEASIGASMDEMVGKLELDAPEEEGEGAGVKEEPKASAKEPGEGEPAKPLDPNAPLAPRSAPRSWAKEHHEAWGKLDPRIQDYIELREKQMGEGVEQVRGDAEYGRQLRQALQPFLPDIQAMRATEAQAIQYLMGAHQMLSRGTPEQRGALFLKIAKDYGVDVKQLAGAVGEAPAPNPEVVELRQQLQGLTRHLTSQQQQQLEQQRNSVMTEVKAFFSDPAHPYAEEVADHLVLLLQNPSLTLKDAYEQAVWANPVTRAKEQARLQQESEKALREKAEKEAAEAEKARGTRVRGAPTETSSSEPLGSIDQTLRETYRKVQARG